MPRNCHWIVKIAALLTVTGCHAAEGGLYVLLRNAWVIDDKFRQGTGSLLKISLKSHAGHNP